MELPTDLRLVLDHVLDGLSLRDLETGSRRLTDRYRSELRDGQLHLNDMGQAHAYVTTRMPATFAAAHASFSALAERLPDFHPTSLLDVGSGPGTALFAAQDCFQSLANATLIEASAPIRAVGEALIGKASRLAVEWVDADIRRNIPTAIKADLVTLCYVLNELEEKQRLQVVEQLWNQCASVFVIVEPGTPEGWKRLIQHRDQLIALGGRVIAPCLHQLTCPVAEPDWCHFSQRVSRSKAHRLAKLATVPYEDEKFAYLAVSRLEASPSFARVLARPLHGSGKSSLKLCQTDGRLSQIMLTKRDGQAYKAARKLEWGDLYEPDTAHEG